jgi:hypothetical protein
MRSHECISWACSPSNGMKTSANGGADPLVRAGPPGPAASSIDKYQQQADVGVGRGPGGPPHFVFVHLGPSVFDGANAANTIVRATRVAHSCEHLATEPKRSQSVNAARKSVPITADRATILMNIKDLPAAASFTFEGACATRRLHHLWWAAGPCQLPCGRGSVAPSR